MLYLLYFIITILYIMLLQIIMTFEYKIRIYVKNYNIFFNFSDFIICILCSCVCSLYGY